jgi:hypothetical protein
MIPDTNFIILPSYNLTIYNNMNHNTKNTKAFGTTAAENPLERLDIQRRAVLDNDVEIEILFCGICHSDLHSAKNEWYGTTYPIVPVTKSSERYQK